MRSRFAALILSLALAACSAGGPTPLSEPMAVEAELAPMVADGAVAEIAPSPVGRKVRARAGVLTAGDIDDGLNLAAFLRGQRKARAAGIATVDLSRPVTAQLVGPRGAPAPGVFYTLRRPGAAEPFFQGYSGVDGMISVYPRLHGAGGLREVEVWAFGDAQGAGVVRRLGTGKREVVAVPEAGGWRPGFVDLVIVIDTTGSMGDEIAWLRKDLRRIVSGMRGRARGANLRLGLVAYRDRGDQYVVRNYGFTGSVGQMQGWLRGLDASGGGDYPEAADRALAAAAGLNWRRGKGERLLFHIADAPPHRSGARGYLSAAGRLAARQVQVFGLGASGVADEAEALMRQAAVMSGGRYLFLTDDSGVGRAHAEPRVACYRVTALTGLVNRVLASELTGRRVEAAPREVIREVGRYDRGRCVN